MSSIRKAAPRRTHRERAQPAARARLGLLEKHKDYVLRAQDFHKKEKAIKTLQEKAAFRNPDEFYFGMVNAQTKRGVHIQRRNEKFDHDFLTLLKTQDQNYINYQRSVNLKKLERLKGGVHIVDEDEDGDDGAQQDGGAGSSSGKQRNAGAHRGGDDDDDDEFGGFGPDDDDDELGIFDGMDADEATEPASAPAKNKPKHIIFVDDEKHAKSFDPVKHFDTVPELVHKPASRLRKTTLETHVLPELSSRDARKLAKKREALAAELASRMEREEKLRTVQLEMQIQKDLMGRGARIKVVTDERGLPVYKWKARRRK